MTIFEHVTGWCISKYIFNLKVWIGGIAICFALNTVYGMLFHQVQGGFFEGLFIIALLNGFLCVCALVGVGVLFAIGFIEDLAIKQIYPQSETIENSET